jgi:hypothetical protein
VIRGSLLLVLGAALLVCASLLFGLAPGTAGGSAFEWITRGWGDLRPSAARLTAFVGLWAMLAGIRTMVLARLRRKPIVAITEFEWEGPHTDPEPSAPHLTAEVRRKLGELQFGAADPLPGAGAATASVQILDALSEANKIVKVLARVASIVLPAAAYEVSGRVRRQEAGRAEIVVDVRAVGRTNGRLVSAVVEHDDWPVATLHAAYAVAGVILPRLRGRRSDPWSHWPSSVPLDLMASYYTAQQLRRSRRLEEALSALATAVTKDPINQVIRLDAGEIEEHLELFLDAWADYLAVVERSHWRRRPWRAHRSGAHAWYLGRYRLAILLGYGRASAQWMRPETSDTPSGQRCDALDSSERQQPGARSQRDQDRQWLRRELVTSLTTDPWLDDDEQKIRHLTSDRRAWHMWQRFERNLHHLLGGAVKPNPALLLTGDRTGFDEADSATDGSPEPWNGCELAKVNGVPRSLLIEEMLQIIACRDLRRLRRGLLWGGPLRFILGCTGVPLSSRSVRVAREWIDLRTARTRYFRTICQSASAAAAAVALASTEPPAPGWAAARARVRHAMAIAAAAAREAHAAQDAYRRAIEKVLQRWSKPERSRRHAADTPPFKQMWRPPWSTWGIRLHHAKDWIPLLKHERWLVYYNAACLLAIPLLPVPSSAENVDNQAIAHESYREDLIRAAMQCLERFVQLAGSGRTQAHARWIAADDPDLAGLRDTPEFRTWAWRELGLRTDKLRPRGAEVAIVTLSLLRRVAAKRAELWRERRDHPAATSRDELDWWTDECATLKTLHRLCVDYRDWRTRSSGLEALRGSPWPPAIGELVICHGEEDPTTHDALQSLLRDPASAKQSLNRQLSTLGEHVRTELDLAEIERTYAEARYNDNQAVTWPSYELRARRHHRVEMWTKFERSMRPNGEPEARAHC